MKFKEKNNTTNISFSKRYVNVCLFFFLLWTFFECLRTVKVKIKIQSLFDSKIIEHSKSLKLKHNHNYFLFMQHLSFQNIMNYFIKIAVQEFKQIRSDLYLQMAYSYNVFIINLYNFCVYSYDTLKKYFEKRYKLKRYDHALFT